jgi:hypothetical protein
MKQTIKLTMRALLVTALLLAPLAVSQAAEAADARVALMQRVEDYTLLWWADGPPHFLRSTSPPTTETLCFQSGVWGLALDTKTVRVLRAGAWAAPMAMEKALQPGRAELAELPSVVWDCAVVADGRRFTCVARLETKDEFFQPVRLVESGRFFQRVVIEGL